MKENMCMKGSGFMMILGFFLAIGCRKAESVQGPGRDASVQQAELWYANLLKKVDQEAGNERYRRKMHHIGDSLQWSAASVYDDGGLHFTVVPVKSSDEAFTNRKFVGGKALVFYDSGGVSKMKIIETVADREKAPAMNVAQLAHDAFLHVSKSAQSTRVSGEAHVLSYGSDYALEASLKVGEGRFIKENFRLLASPVGGVSDERKKLALSNQRGPYFETWYTVGIWYDLDTGDIISYAILSTYQQCVMGCDEYVPQDDWGDTGASGEQCVDNSLSDFSNMVNNSTTDNTIESMSSTFADATGLRKNVYIEWTCLKNLTWHLTSHEVGVIEAFTPAATDWFWVSLTHQTISMQGASWGGSVTPDNGVGVSSITSAAQKARYAGMDLHFNVTYQPLDVCDMVKTFIPAVKMPYNSSGFFPAKP